MARGDQIKNAEREGGGTKPADWLSDLHRIFEFVRRIQKIEIPHVTGAGAEASGRWSRGIRAPGPKYLGRNSRGQELT